MSIGPVPIVRSRSESGLDRSVWSVCVPQGHVPGHSLYVPQRPSCLMTRVREPGSAVSPMSRFGHPASDQPAHSSCCSLASLPGAFASLCLSVPRNVNPEIGKPFAVRNGTRQRRFAPEGALPPLPTSRPPRLESVFPNLAPHNGNPERAEDSRAWSGASSCLTSAP
ncbi:hypothetical protein GY45DRAFT_171871 [Cubamyces sp. BRFM 1775]|nr:hypothetical protein GY45DRAFT_171871 [Cubamyces sp. BRFM 1775]